MGRINGGRVEAPIGSIRGVARGDGFGGGIGGSLLRPVKQTPVEGSRGAHPKIIQPIGDRCSSPTQTIRACSHAVVERVKENSVGMRHEVVDFRLCAGSYIKSTRTHTSPIGTTVGANH